MRDLRHPGRFRKWVRDSHDPVLVNGRTVRIIQVMHNGC